MAAVGDQAHGDLGSTPKAAPLDQPRYHRPATQTKKTVNFKKDVALIV
jgi:hypothetical protein